MQQVELLTRQLGDTPGAEVVVAVRLDGIRIELPLDSTVRVVHQAGGGTPVVHLNILAGSVRYVPDPEVTP